MRDRDIVATKRSKELLDRGSRTALFVFVIVLILAAVLYVVVGRRYWFFQDDWTFIAHRDGGSLHDVLVPHHDHWSTVPIVAFRVLWNVFGLHTYRPYQMIVIALHLTAALLLWIVMRRSGVRPWTTTVVASAFVLLAGSGWMDIVWAFQIGFVGALVCGLAHLLLADHDGPLDRRDVTGLAIGAIGLLCGGVAITMTIVVGIAVLIRRGWRIALVHTVPLAVVYMVWWYRFARDSGGDERLPLRTVPRFMFTGFANALDRIGRLSAYRDWGPERAGGLGVGLGLGVVLVVGLFMAWARRPWAELRREAAMPMALFVGALLFLLFVGLGRGTEFDVNYATRSRFVHIVVALTVPALAVAADALARRWRVLTPFVLALFLVGIPRNIADLWPDGRPSDRLALAGTDVVGDPDLFLAVANSPLLDEVPPGMRPFRGAGSQTVTVGWIRDAVASGRVPDASSPADDADAILALSMQQTGTYLIGSCRAVQARTQRFARGDDIVFEGMLLVQLVDEDAGTSHVVAFDSSNGQRLVAVVGPVTLELAPANPDTRECG